jgi:aminoglycoside phosphotransferase (APT) family kinase protein
MGLTVTVNTVTVNTVKNSTGVSGRLEDDLLAVLRKATGLPVEYATPPTPLTGGYWAELARFSLRGAPPDWSGELVARVMPDAGVAAKESAVQAEVAALGYPTPAVHLHGGPEAGLGRAFMVMDLATGAPMMAGLGGVGAVVALPRLVRSLPVLLADSMARLHRLDPEPVRGRLDGAGASWQGMVPVVASLGESAAVLGRGDLAAAAAWLAEHAPGPEPDVICHGDLHPFNVLVDTDGSVTVLDWSAALLAPAAYDVAFTGLVLAEPPVAVPGPLRPAIRVAGRWLARRFRRAYEQRAAVTLDARSITWHEGVVCLRALVEVAGWCAAGSVAERRGHPWLVCGPAFAERLAAATGVPVAART